MKTRLRDQVTMGPRYQQAGELVARLVPWYPGSLVPNLRLRA